MGPAAQDAVPDLIRVLQDEDWQVEQAAAKALGEVGPAAKDAVPELTRLLRDKSAEVRETAARALERIER